MFYQNKIILDLTQTYLAKMYTCNIQITINISAFIHQVKPSFFQDYSTMDTMYLNNLITKWRQITCNLGKMVNITITKTWSYTAFPIWYITRRDDTATLIIGHVTRMFRIYQWMLQFPDPSILLILLDIKCLIFHSVLTSKHTTYNEWSGNLLVQGRLQKRKIYIWSSNLHFLRGTGFNFFPSFRKTGTLQVFFLSLPLVEQHTV